METAGKTGLKLAGAANGIPSVDSPNNPININPIARAFALKGEDVIKKNATGYTELKPPSPGTAFFIILAVAAYYLKVFK